MIKVTINGKDHELSGPTPVSDYVATLGVEPKMIAIAHNGEVLRRDEWDDVTVSEGDTLEVVRAVGGG